VEIETDRYGWIEIIGIADRTDFDLKSHSKHSKEDLRVFIEYDQPKTVKKLVAKPQMKKFGPLFKGDTPKIMEALKEMDASQIKDSFQESGDYPLEIEGKTHILTPDIIDFQEVEETVRGEKIYPHVIEPSYGIDRIIYSVLLHCYHKEGDRTILKLPADIAPVEVNVFPLVNKEELATVAWRIRDELRREGLIAEYDASGTIGRRYARSDEIGVPYAVTVDHQTLEDDTVTIRNRDDSKQVRIPLEDIYMTLGSLIYLKTEFEEL
jgi:glycyl-tRNA synthetase